MLLSGEVSRVAKGADCKSAASWLRRFESFLPHHPYGFGFGWLFPAIGLLSPSPWNQPFSRSLLRVLNRRGNEHENDNGCFDCVFCAWIRASLGARRWWCGRCSGRRRCCGSRRGSGWRWRSCCNARSGHHRHEQGHAQAYEDAQAHEQEKETFNNVSESPARMRGFFTHSYGQMCPLAHIQSLAFRRPGTGIRPYLPRSADDQVPC